MTTSSDESFLARWSRLKRLPEPPHQPEPDAAELPPNDTVALRHGGADEGAEDEIVSQEEVDGGERAELKEPLRDFTDFDFEKLDFDSDYRQFMDRDVPHDVRNKALRKLWLSNPVLANMDGLDDYCEDYTDAAVVPLSGVKTAYKIGQGFLSDSEVADWEALGKPEELEVAAAEDNGSVDATAADEAAQSAEAGDEPTPLGGGEHDDGEHGEPEHAASVEMRDDGDGGAGTACVTSVKLEEQAALDDYDRSAEAGTGRRQDGSKTSPKAT